MWKPVHKGVLAATINDTDMQADADKGQKEEITSFER